jgi:general secretion pathway protein G
MQSFWKRINKDSLKASQNGFTLVELLVVISIISVLVTVIAGGFRSSQARGRDVQRKSDLKQVANSLELYYSDYGKYPDSVPWGLEFTDGKTVYFKVVPTDPSSSLSYYYRLVDPPTNQKYQLFARLENTEDPDCLGGDCANPTVVYACGTKNCNFSITSTNTIPTE